MPVVRDIPLSLPFREVLRWEGLREHTPVRPEMERLVRELLEHVAAERLLEPVAVYEIYPLTGKDPPALPPQAVPPGTEAVGVVVATIGPWLEAASAAYFKQGQPRRGILLDGIGNAAVDCLTGEVCRLIAGEAAARGWRTGGITSPGMLGFPVTEQKTLFELVPAREIGVSLTRGGVMVPLKSSSMLIAMGPQLKPETTAALCRRCHLKKTCQYRAPAEGRAGRK